MATHQIEVVIPEDRRLVVKVPETVHAGPATLIFVTPSEGPAEAEELPESARHACTHALARDKGRAGPGSASLPPTLSRGAARSAAPAARNRPGSPFLERRIRTPQGRRDRGEEVCPLMPFTSSTPAL